VLRGNERALAFYARYGFRADGRTKIHADTGLSEIRLVRDGGDEPLLALAADLL
jgi:hypothetical protein